jgi:hypothetical protein
VAARVASGLATREAARHNEARIDCPRTRGIGPRVRYALETVDDGIAIAKTATMRSFFFLSSIVFLVCACSSEESQPEETREDFCERWGEAACSDEVVSVCQSASASACRLSQESYCLSLVPAAGFASAQADACIGAIGAAYADADLNAAELKTVLRLAAPCDRLIRGPQEDSETCTERTDCDTAADFTCVIKGAQTQGRCAIPREVEAGRDCSADNAVCEAGFFCDGDNCIEQRAAGAACVRNEQCAEGYCDGSECTAGLGIDTACTSDEQCASGFCFEFSSTSQVCTDRVRLSRTDPICRNLR